MADENTQVVEEQQAVAEVKTKVAAKAAETVQFVTKDAHEALAAAFAALSERIDAFNAKSGHKI